MTLAANTNGKWHMAKDGELNTHTHYAHYALRNTALISAFCFLDFCFSFCE